MKPVGVAALIAAGISCASSAGAGLIPLTGPFFTAPADGTLTFTFEGYSASHIDRMVFAFNGDALFTNESAVVGDVVHETVVQGQIYQLSLHDNNTRDTWSSDRGWNWDGLAHLASTSIFSDFHLGSALPRPSPAHRRASSPSPSASAHQA